MNRSRHDYSDLFHNLMVILFTAPGAPARPVRQCLGGGKHSVEVAKASGWSARAYRLAIRHRNANGVLAGLWAATGRKSGKRNGLRVLSYPPVWLFDAFRM